MRQYRQKKKKEEEKKQGNGPRSWGEGRAAGRCRMRALANGLVYLVLPVRCGTEASRRNAACNRDGAAAVRPVGWAGLAAARQVGTYE